MRALLVAVSLAVVSLSLASPAAPAQEVPDPSLLLVLDASGSMNGDDGTGRPKIEAAKQALRTVVDGLPAGAPVGLRVYGHRIPNTDKANGCQDSELVVPVGPLEPGAMKAGIDSFDATGFTPIGLSLQEAARDLPPEGERTVVLVSDGEDTCAPPDPCQVAADLVQGGVNLRIETVGFQVDAAAAEQLRCIADATGGTYRDAPDAASLTRGLEELSARAFRNYSVSGTTVRGAATAADAPLLDPGQYRDRIVSNQVLYYGVRLDEGQELRTTMTFVGEADGPTTSGNLRLELLDPDEEVTDTDFFVGPGRTAESISAQSGRTGSGQGGQHWIRLELTDPAEQLLPGGYDIELLVEVDTSATVPAGGPSGGAPSAQDTGPTNPGQSQTIAASTIVLVGLGCAVAGFLTGAWGRRRLLRGS